MKTGNLDLWIAGLGALVVFGLVWAGLWTHYGIWGAVFGWLPGAILGAIAGLALTFFWRAILTIIVLLGAGLWLLVQCGGQ